MDEQKDKIEIKITNLNPRKDPVTYQLSTLQEIADAVTNDNIEGFLKDFELVLRSNILMRAIVADGIEKGELPKEEKILLPSFKWIDDWKRKRKRKPKSQN